MPGIAGAKQKQNRGKGKVVNVMTRNLYLGADLAPAISAPGIAAFTEANGQILREVTANNFPVRAKGLAKEILKRSPISSGCRRWRCGERARRV